jgi:hypothetical protein
MACLWVQVPKHVREHRPIDGFAKVPHSPKDPHQIFQPFQLASMEKHEK